VLVYSTGAAITLISILRLLLVKFFNLWYTKNSTLWRWLFGLGVLVSAAIWSAFSAWSLFHIGASVEAIIILIPLFLFCSGGIVSLTPNKSLLFLFPIILLLPQIVVFIFMGTMQAYVIVFMFIIFKLFLLKIALKMHTDYWEILNISEEKYRLYANVFEYSTEAILITDKNNRIISNNRTLSEDTGYSMRELHGKKPDYLKSNYTTQVTNDEISESLQEKGHWKGEIWIQAKNGESLLKWAVVSSIQNEKGELTNYIASYTDLSERKEAEERIYKLAHHDSLTGLFNRATLGTRLEQAIFTAKRNKEHLAIIFIDMDHFKVINDTKGHDIGDALLIEVARRLKNSVRECDIVARQGGDEFVVVLTQLKDYLVSSHIASNIVDTLGQTYQISGYHLNSSPSLGISIFPNDGDDAVILLKQADTAMYYTKENGRNNYHFFTEEMNKKVTEKVVLENELKKALDDDQFVLYYQPKISGINGKLTGFEALIRWQHPEKGLIFPDKFIPVCEESKLIIPLGNWVINEACHQLEIWNSAGFPKMTLAINLSLQQFQSSHFVNNVADILSNYAIEAKNIEFELTETMAMYKPETTIKQLQQLKQLGIQLAIDDFGTGYSSLAYLKRLPIRSLKIDKTFISNLDTDESDAIISAATLSLAHNLDLEVVAEGVENKKQEEFLMTRQCDYLQGYLYSKPLPSDQTFKFIQENI